jgi:transglutaminase-like putative cysteine protease
MLESGDLSGKCADINSLFVGLCRSIGIPARDVYGVRVADSRWGFKSLGRSADITKAQHCRAEVWLADFGWVAVDPADVRKVLLEEKPGLTLDDALVRQARARFFGGWEMNWMPYNVAHDVALPDADGPPIPFLMYPQAQTGGRRLDSLDPESFRYALTSREVID